MAHGTAARTAGIEFGDGSRPVSGLYWFSAGDELFVPLERMAV